MALQGSGAISFSQLQSEFGGSSPISLSEYYKGGSYVGNNYSYSNYGTPLTGDYAPNVPTSGRIDLSDFHGADNVTYWSESASPVKTGISAKYTPIYTSFSVSTYLGSIANGTQFRVSIQDMAATPWIQKPHMCVILSKGTSKSQVQVRQYSKQWLLSLSYDGNNTITIGGYYEGNSTDSSQGGCFLRSISLG